jgi:hypothetical protein
VIIRLFLGQRRGGPRGVLSLPPTIRSSGDGSMTGFKCHECANVDVKYAGPEMSMPALLHAVGLVMGQDGRDARGAQLRGGTRRRAEGGKSHATDTTTCRSGGWAIVWLKAKDCLALAPNVGAQRRVCKVAMSFNNGDQPHCVPRRSQRKHADLCNSTVLWCKVLIATTDREHAPKNCAPRWAAVAALR